MTDARPKIVCIAGTTASGKSSLAMETARRIGAEILSVDSMQVYRGFDIGTAKPTAAERAEIPHHGLDLVDPTDWFSAGRFLDQAREVVADASRRGVPLLAVGGTGLYLRAMLHGLAPEVPSDPAFRVELRDAEARETGSMHRRLATVDPGAADRLHPNDLIRIERAVEVHHATGRRLSDLQAEHRFKASPFHFQVWVLVRPRDELRLRVRARIHAMFEAGWIEEVRGLLESGVPVDAPAMRALGYREVAAHLQGDAAGEDPRGRIETLTMRFAKRQTTWFNREPSVGRLNPSPESSARFMAHVEAFLRPSAMTPAPPEEL